MEPESDDLELDMSKMVYLHKYIEERSKLYEHEDDIKD
jgi:hypothetical protein